MTFRSQQKRKRIRVLSDDDDSDKEEEGEEEARDKLAKQIFDPNDDDDTSAPVEREMHSPKPAQEFGDLSASSGDESGTNTVYIMTIKSYVIRCRRLQ